MFFWYFVHVMQCFSQVQAEQKQQQQQKSGMQLLKQLCTSHEGHNDRKHKQATTASLWVCITRSENFLALQNKTWHG